MGMVIDLSDPTPLTPVDALILVLNASWHIHGAKYPLRVYASVERELHAAQWRVKKALADKVLRRMV
jgi:hypothetical protein